jgi:hypothetical protein
MNVQVNTTYGQQPSGHLLEDAFDEFGHPIVRKWKIQGPNRFQPLGWDIKDGGTTRIVFPIDLPHYYLS